MADLIKRVPCSGSHTQYRFVEITTVSSKRVATPLTTAGGTRNLTGVLLDSGVASGDLGSVQFTGQVRMTAGGNLSAGNLITTDTSGRCVAASTENHYILGVCLGRVSNLDTTQISGAVSGDLVEVLLFDNKLSQVPA